MKVQIVDQYEGQDVIIWEHIMDVKIENDGAFHLGHKPHMEGMQNNIDCLSIAKNKAVQDALHHFAMYVHKHGTYDIDA